MTQTVSFTQDQLLAVANELKHDYFVPEMIRQLHKMEGGAEMLRLIVRDNLQGTADKIASALWGQLAN